MDEKENLNNTPDGEEEKTIEEPDGENGVIELKASKIVKVNVEDEMKKSFIAYAMAVNVSRAIPDVRDGLKPVHRRILYAMSELGLYSDKPHRKCARIVGDVLGKYHPHGDIAVYEALVRLAQDFSIRCPLVDGHGNFGSVDGDPAAAQRYTEARLSKIASEMLRDIDKKTVDFYPNFDDTLEQPVVLPARFPNLLVNGSDGIAVGMATSIPPHNLGEVIDGTVALIKNPELTDEELMEYIPCPDYPTGGLVMGRAAIRQAYKTGHGGAIIRAKAEIETYNNNQRTRIVVTEIPYQVNKAKLIENIADQVKDKKIEGISDIKEESDRKGMRIVIEVKKDAVAEVVLNKLYKQTNMQITNSMILLALVNGRPKICSLKEILHYYILHQREVIVRRTKFDLERALEREHIVEGLVIALANIDEVIRIIKASSDKQDAQDKLMASFTLSDKQANAILEMRLQRLTALEVEKLNEELAELKKAIDWYRQILASEELIDKIIIDEMTEIKRKYATPRRSELTYDSSEINIADLIEREDVVISMTHGGYIKRLPVDEYRAQKRGGVGISAHKTKEDDFVENLFITCTHDDMLFFSNFGKVYRIKAFEVPEAQRSAKGRAIINLLQLADGEKITASLPLKELQEGEKREGYLVLATKQGLIKKTKIEEFDRIRANGKIAISLLEGDELISASLTSGNDEILIASSSGKCIRFSESNLRSIGRTSQGVKSMKLDKGERIVDATVVREGVEVLTITENGYGKRSDIDEYRLQSRAGKGIKAGNFNEKTGDLVNLKLINPEDDVMIIADSGTVIRIQASEISKISRDTQGVRLMRIRNNAKVVSFSVTPHIDEENEEETAAENQQNQSAENNVVDSQTQTDGTHQTE